MAGKCWLVKQEPEDFSWNDLVREGRTSWTGVRNFQARKNLREMRVNDWVLFYHSGEEKSVVGIAIVVREAYADPTMEPEERPREWVCVDIAPVKPLIQPVSLAQVKSEPTLMNLPLVKQSRLSVMPVCAAELRKLLRLAETSL